MVPAFDRVFKALRAVQNKEGMEKLVKELTDKHPKLLISAIPDRAFYNPLIHNIAVDAKHKSVMELCVQISGQTVLEVGDSHTEATLIFKVDGYQLLKRTTELGSRVNVCSKRGTVLEHFVSRRRKGGITELEWHRCVKHLIRLGACIQKDSPLSEPLRSRLTSVYEEFSKEITAVRKKTKVVEDWIGVTVLKPIILDYVYGEEDSETPVYDKQGKYALDDETEAYAYINSKRASSAS